MAWLVLFTTPLFWTGCQQPSPDDQQVQQFVDSIEYYAQKKQFDVAESWTLQALQHFQQTGNTEQEGRFWAQRLSIMVNLGRGKQVRALFSDSVANCFEALENDSLKAELLLLRAWSERIWGDFVQAGATHREGLVYTASIPETRARLLMGLSVCDRITNSFYQHRQHLNQAARAIDLVPMPNQQRLRVDLYSFQGKAFASEGNYHGAAEYGRACLEQALSSELPIPEYALGTYHLNLARYLYKINDSLEADSLLAKAEVLFEKTTPGPMGKEFLTVYRIRLAQALDHQRNHQVQAAMEDFMRVVPHHLKSNFIQMEKHHLQGSYFAHINQLDSMHHHFLAALRPDRVASVQSRLGVLNSYCRALQIHRQPKELLEISSQELAFIQLTIGTLKDSRLLGDAAMPLAKLQLFRARAWQKMYTQKQKVAYLDSALAASRMALQLQHGTILSRLSYSQMGANTRLKGLYDLGFQLLMEKWRLTKDAAIWYEARDLADAANTLRLSGRVALDQWRSNLNEALLLRGDSLWSQLSGLRRAIYRQKRKGQPTDSLRVAFRSVRVQHDLYQQELLTQLPDFSVFSAQTTTRSTENDKLIPKGALLQWLQTERTTYALVAGPQGKAILELGNDWHQHLTPFLSGIQKNKKNELAEAGFALYEQLIAPLTSTLAAAKAVTIVPSGDLFYLPFGALPTQEVSLPERAYTSWPFWVKDVHLQYAYRAGTLQPSTSHSDTSALKFLALAPVFMSDESEEGAALPASEKEVESMAKMLRSKGHQVELKTREEATKRNFKNLANQFDVLHVASHSVSPKGDPRLSSLAFSKESPDEDGMLYLSELYRIPLRARLVVVSSCESGAGEVEAGEGLISLGHGMLSAGAENVLVANWKLYDDHTQTLMEAFYQQWPERGEAMALAAAQRQLLEQARTSAPKVWAGFRLMKK